MSLFTDRVDSRARLIKSEGQPHRYGFKIWRSWPKVHSGSTDTMAVSLGSVKFVTSPKAENKTYSGTFAARMVQTDKDQEEAYEPTQELTKVRTDLTDSNAIMEEIEGRPWQYGYRIGRSWRYVDPRSVDTLFVARQAVKVVTNPKGDNQTYTGAFLQSPLTVKKEPDETATVAHNLVLVRTNLVDSNATLDKIDGRPHRYGFRIHRLWRYVDPRSADTLFTAKNAIKFISNPKVDHQAYSGTFAQSPLGSNKSDDDSVTIDQWLTLVRTNLTDSNAILDKVDGRPHRYGFRIHRLWPYVDPRSTDTLFVAKNAIKFIVSPKVDNQTYTGTFAQSPLGMNKTEDETVVMDQWLTLVRTNLTDSNAVLVGTEGDPAHAGYRIKEEWPFVDPRSVDTLTTAKNAVVTLVNPKVDNQQYTDTFVTSQLTPVKQEDETVTIGRTLTKVKGIVAESDADLMTMTGDPKTVGVEIIRGWHYINPVSVQRLVNTLNSTKTYSGISLNGLSVSGTFAVGQNKAVETEDRSYRIEQSVKKVRTVGSDTDLLNPIIQREKEAIHPFGNGTGTGWGIVFEYPNLNPVSDTKCIVFKDTALVAHKAKVYAKASGDSYSLVDRKTTIKDDNTLTFYLLFQRKNRTDTVAAASPDFREYANKGRRNEVRKKLWYGRDRKHHATNLALLEAATNDTGFYTIGSVEFADDDNGAKSYIWTQAKSWSDTRTDSQFINPHGITHVANAIKRTEAHGYTVAGLPADPALTAGYDFVQKQIVRNPNTGMLDKEFVQTKATASNTVSSGTPTTTDTLAYEGKGTMASLGNAGQRRRFVADRIPVATAPAVVKTWGRVGDDSHVVAGNGAEDRGDGSAQAWKQVFRFNKTGASFVRSVKDSTATLVPQAERVWPYIADTKATALMAKGGGARVAFVLGTDSYLGGEADREIHYELGLSTVVQRSTDKRFVTTQGAWADWRNFTDSLRYTIPQWRRIRKAGVETDQVRFFSYAYRIKQTTNKSTAYAFSGSTGRTPVKAKVEILAKSRYRAIAIYASVDCWAVADPNGYTDLGSKTAR